MIQFLSYNIPFMIMELLIIIEFGLNGSIMRFSTTYLVVFIATASASTNIEDVSVSYQ